MNGQATVTQPVAPASGRVLRWAVLGLLALPFWLVWAPGTKAADAPVSSMDRPSQTATLPSSDSPGGRVEAYPYPRLCPRSTTFKVRGGGQELFVYHTSAGDFATFGSQGSVVIEIEAPRAAQSVRIAPARHGIKPTLEGNLIRFTLPAPQNLWVEIEGLDSLFIFAQDADQKVPKPDDPGVKYFRGGQVYEVGELRLHDNETLYLEGGAVVRGCIRATGARNVRIAGPGVLDGSYYRRGVDAHRSVVLEGCRDSRVEDIIMIEPTAWMVVLGACQDVVVRNVRELGSLGSTDGVDIVGSRRIRVENCFCRNGDDCIVIKSLDLRAHGRDATLDYSADVEDIEVSGCALMAYIGGQAMEIGHELRTGSVGNIRFRDCDVLAVHGHGGVFGIHNADRATVSDVLYENIRVEHHYEKLLDFRVIKSRWSKDEERGQIRNVTLRNIDVAISVFNPGYSCSVIGGLDSQHTVEHVRFEQFRKAGRLVTCADEMDLYSKQASDITFR
jgi:hypothetical protein